MIEFTLNGQKTDLDLDPEMPLLWALRDHLGMTGTKFGCGSGYCGACTVHVNGTATRSCQLKLAAVKNLEITTIEAFGEDAAHPVQQAWAEVNVAQCGYCQVGQVMSAIALLEDNPSPDETEIARAMNGNLCRCGSYPRIIKAVNIASEIKKKQAS